MADLIRGLVNSVARAMVSASTTTDTANEAPRPSGIGESSDRWIVLAVVLIVLVALTFYALRRPGGGGGKTGFGPIGAVASCAVSAVRGVTCLPARM